MAKSYHSIVLDQSAGEVWAVIRPFDHYAWAGVETEVIIEHGKSGDQDIGTRLRRLKAAAAGSMT